MIVRLKSLNERNQQILQVTNLRCLLSDYLVGRYQFLFEINVIHERELYLQQTGI